MQTDTLFQITPLPPYASWQEQAFDFARFLDACGEHADGADYAALEDAAALIGRGFDPDAQRGFVSLLGERLGGADTAELAAREWAWSPEVAHATALLVAKVFRQTILARAAFAAASAPALAVAA